MSDRLSRITKNIIRGGTAVAIGASAWACEKGYIVPDSVQTKTPITELVPPPTSTETISNEKISRYGQFEIGEVKIGVISDLKIQTNPDLNIVNKVKDLALLSIPEAKDKEISINIYDMIGDKGTAPFITASVNDSNGNLEFAYVGFSLDENNIQRPPIDGDIDIFYPLRVVEQEDKSVFIGIPDQTTQNLQTPIMFYIDQNNDTYFYPPYTDYLAQNDTTYGGMKVQAMLLKPEVLAPKTVEQLNISNPETFKFRSWEELTSPAYLAELEQKEKAGLLPSIPENPFYVKQGYVNLLFNKEPSNLLKKYGIESIFSLSNEVSYLNMSKRPFALVEAYKTEYLGIKMIFLVKKWENEDKSKAFVADFIFDYNNNTTKDILASSYNDSSRYSTGGYFAKESERGEGCKAYINQLARIDIDSSEFCKYYYGHPEIFLPEDVYINWQSTGILNTKGTLPVTPIMTNKISQ